MEQIFDICPSFVSRDYELERVSDFGEVDRQSCTRLIFEYRIFLILEVWCNTRFVDSACVTNLNTVL